jgi:hypothetical protein
MSWTATAWIAGCKLGGPRRKGVMLAVADCASEDLTQLGITVEPGWSCCPAGLDRIAEKAEVSRATVKRVLADMVAAGVIRREVRYRTYGDGGRTSDLLWIETARPYVTVAPDFRAPRREVSEAHLAASRRGGLASAERRRNRTNDEGVRAQTEPGLGLTPNRGLGSTLNPHEPPVVPQVEPPADHLGISTTGRPSTGFAQPGSSPSARALRARRTAGRAT